MLAVWENGYRHITNNKRPIKVPDDLKGIKLRVPEGKWRVKMFQAYGANPSPMKFSELFTALQTGVMDGEENPLTQIYSAKLQEVQKYLSLSGHVYTPAYLDRRHAQVGDAAGRRAQGPRGHGQGNAGVRLRDRGAEDDDDLLGQAQGRRACRSTRSTRTPSSPRASRSTRSSASEVAGAKALLDQAAALGK